MMREKPLLSIVTEFQACPFFGFDCSGVKGIMCNIRHFLTMML
jgi:hypothetical protein